MQLKTARSEVEAEFAVHKECTRVGLKIAHSASMSSLIIYFSHRYITMIMLIIYCVNVQT